MDIELSLIAEQLGKNLRAAAPQIQAEINAAVENLAHAVYASIVAKVQGMSMDPKNRKDYLRALKFQDLGDSSWLIFLDGDWPNKLEQGFEPYSIKDVLLASDKRVEVGSRAGEPWVRKSKAGQRYAAVPFDHKPFSGEKMSGNLADDIKKILVANRSGSLQPITKIFKDLDGKPLQGKVAVGGKHENPNLSGLTKYQHVSDKGAVSSIYTTYRIVSDSSSGWQHKGFSGYSLFEEAEKYVKEELTKVVSNLL